METRTRHSVWAERYDREIEDVFAIQDEIARSIAQALRVTLTPQEEKTIARKPTDNLQAYDYYLRGRNYTRRENLDFALQMFEQAIKLDPGFALAHAGVANVCGMIFELREQHPRWIERGLTACDRALALDPQAAEVLAARARVYYAQKKYEQAAQHARLAIERKPDCEGAYNILGRALFASDRWQEAAALVDRALEANGDDYNTYIPYTNALARLGQNAAAARLAERQVAALEQQLELVPEDVRAEDPAGEPIRHVQPAGRCRAAARDGGGAAAERRERPVQRRLHVRAAGRHDRSAHHVQARRRGRLRQHGMGGAGQQSDLPARPARVPPPRRPRLK